MKENTVANRESNQGNVSNEKSRCAEVPSSEHSTSVKEHVCTVKERMCCVCRAKSPMKDLIRIAREQTPTGPRYFVDEAGNANGRGCHIHKTPECLEKAVKTRALNRSYKGNVPAEVYDALKNGCASSNPIAGQTSLYDK